MSKQVLSREEVDKNLTWDLTDIFKSEEEFEAAVKKAEELTDEIESEFKGRLEEAGIINACLDKLRDLYELLIQTSSYAYLAVSVDQTNAENQGRNMMLGNILSQIESRISFIESEIIQVDETIIEEAMAASEMNKGYLQDILRNKPYVLHPEVEKTLSALSNTLDSPHRIYNLAKLADMDFGSFEVEVEVSLDLCKL